MHESFDDLLGELVNQIIKHRAWRTFVLGRRGVEDNVGMFMGSEWQVFLNGVQWKFVQVCLLKGSGTSESVG